MLNSLLLATVSLLSATSLAQVIINVPSGADGADVIDLVTRVVPIANRHYFSESNVLVVRDLAEGIVFALPPGPSDRASAELLKIVTDVRDGHSVVGTARTVTFKNTPVVIETPASPVRTDPNMDLFNDFLTRSREELEYFERMFQEHQVSSGASGTSYVVPLPSGSDGRTIVVTDEVAAEIEALIPNGATGHADPPGCGWHLARHAGLSESD